MEYKSTKELLAEVYKTGVNIYALLGLYKKRSKICVQIPDEVLNNLCKSYLKNNPKVKNSFPYFLRVLAATTEEYFSRQNENESKNRKKEARSGFAPSIAEIMKNV